MQTFVADAGQASIVQLPANRWTAERTAHATDPWARLFMASLAIVFLVLAVATLCAAGAQRAPAPPVSRTFCSNLNWDAPLPFSRCFTIR